MKKISFLFFVLIISSESNALSVLDIKQKGFINCGIILETDNVSSVGKGDVKKGIFPTFCKALSVVIFGESDKVNFIDVNYKNSYQKLRDKEIDVLSAPYPYVYNAKNNDLYFSPPFLYDKVVLLSKVKAEKITEIDNPKICYGNNFFFKYDLKKYLGNNNVKYTLEKKDFSNEGCDVFAINEIYVDKHNNFILKDDITNFYYNIVTRFEDVEISKVVFWTFYSMVRADVLNIKSFDVDEYLKSEDKSLKEFFDNQDLKNIGLSPNSFYNLIKKIGSYKEVYENHFENFNKYNKSWIDGGLILPPPIN
ncbi:MAG: General L-amino acid-binding periplasmic protein AapJ precursor [Alphaproteobacteria bacterium ADurb.Bin438]|nr:MAG: General L-amino acid-binding periplasmic protein AapJ precursor [Alphaproteobacteria bacterium ADurb.Bin438]